jgi:hypothetical protein
MGLRALQSILALPPKVDVERFVKATIGEHGVLGSIRTYQAEDARKMVAEYPRSQRIGWFAVVNHLPARISGR